MFTPPHSPLPTPTNPLDAPVRSSPGPSSTYLAPSPSPSPSPPATPFLPSSPPAPAFALRQPPPHRPRSSTIPAPASADPAHARARKRHLARRTTLTVVLLPLALVLLALASRLLAHRRSPALAPLSAWSHASWPDALPHARRDAAVVTTAASVSLATTLAFPSASSVPASASASSTPTTTTTSTGVPKIPATPPTLPTPFPQPFDSTGAAANFSSQACADTVANMTGSLPFRQCRAFSFLSQVSTEFLQAQSDLAQLNVDVWGTCNTPIGADQCAANMAWFAGALQGACAAELAADNPLVVQSLTSLQTYDLLRQAACLADASTGAYCYLSAAAASSPSDIYLYQLPFGTLPPPSSAPSCSTCARSLLALFEAQAPLVEGLKGTYNKVAADANAKCGDGYAAVATGVAAASAYSASSAGARASSTPALSALVLALAGYYLS